MRRLSLSVLCGGFILGCGGSGSTGIGSGGSVDETKVAAMVSKLKDAFYVNSAKTRPEKIDAYKKIMNESGVCQTVGYNPTTDNVYAVLTNGVPYTFMDNTDAVPAAPDLPFKAPKVPQDMVPASREARIYHMMGNAFYNHTQKFASWLTAAKYNVQTGSGTINQLMNNCRNLGYLYLFGHGGRFKYRDGSEGFEITTLIEDTPDRRSIEPYKTLLQEGSIIRSAATTDRLDNPVDRNNNGTIEPEEKLKVVDVFSITHIFFEKYMSFGQASVVIIPACSSMDKFIIAALEKDGADTYFGWDLPAADNGSVTARIMDLLLGQDAPYVVKDPELRAFQVGLAYDFLVAHSMNEATTPYLGIKAKMKLQVLKDGGDFGLLRPAIKSMRITESVVPGQKDRIQINGIFGPYSPSIPRRVTVDGVILNIVVDPDPNKMTNTIVAEIRSEGVGSAGPVVVTINGRESLPVPITQWDVPMKFSFDGPGTCQYTVNYNLKFRGDVHLYRDDVDGSLQGIEYPTISMANSTATWNASGTDGNQTWSGSGTTVSLQKAPLGSAQYCLFTTSNFRPKDRILLQNNVVHGGGGVTVKYKNGATTGFPPAIAVPAFDMKFAAQTFDMIGDTINGTPLPQGVGKLTWPTVPAQYAPDSKTPR